MNIVFLTELWDGWNVVSTYKAHFHFDIFSECKIPGVTYEIYLNMITEVLIYPPPTIRQQSWPKKCIINSHYGQKPPWITEWSTAVLFTNSMEFPSSSSSSWVCRSLDGRTSSGWDGLWPFLWYLMDFDVL